MNNLIKRLPLFAFVLAAFAAFAFTSPKNVGEFGQSGGIWYDVTNETPGPTSYECNNSPDQTCLYDQAFGMGQPLSGSTNKLFVLHDEDIPQAE
ncbi:DUF6520 family protein [Algoriphagus aquimarinus]|uniref:Uncharacterized protein n=1 Tax=Algoriphagus aquimarinus TaxID=237018 RepID=A0A1I1AGB9_9BACT|nr:DUF6520 family protein [Algoriphagus aquimarinus]SFB35540.1 hypothetical protein SAMN04489723_1084 [Algoriphagus aquimarinus]